MRQLRELRYRHIINAHPVPDETWLEVARSRPILRMYDSEEMVRLRELSTLFLYRKEFEQAEGMTLTERMRVLIAVLASIPVLKLGFQWYDNWNTVVVVPTEFVHKRSVRDRSGVVQEWIEQDAGESWTRGPVVLAWSDVEASGWGEGFNVVIHEAAHRLDMTDGSVNGRPALHRGMDNAYWFGILAPAFKDFTIKSRTPGGSLIDSYAATSDAEFFAVLTETFFERGPVVRQEYPEVYRLLCDFYRQDPAADRPFSTV